MNTKPTPIEAKLAKFIYLNLNKVVTKSATHPVFCRLNLHNNCILKKLNSKVGMMYKMTYLRDELVKAPYNYGGQDDVENALIAIREVVKGAHTYKEYLFERINFLASEALHSLYKKDHEEWVERITSAIQKAKQNKKTTKRTSKKSTVKTVKSKSVKKTSKKVKPVERRRNKKGQFIKARR